MNLRNTSCYRISLNRMRSKILTYCIGFLFVLTANNLSGQDMLGLTTGNYAGSNSIYLNPAFIANNRVKMDINLISVGAFLQNNYLYLPKKEATFLSILNGEYNFPYHSKPFGKGDRNIYSYYADNSKKHIYANERIAGPSVLMRYGDHSFVIHTGARLVSSTNRLPYDMANFMFYSMDFKPQHNVNFVRDNYNMAMISWGEVGITYGSVIKRSSQSHWSVGVTVNKMFANSGSYVNGGYTDYIAYNDSILRVNNLTAEVGYAIPYDYDENQAHFTDNLVRGGGWSMDIGVSYQFNYKGYKRKLVPACYNKKFESYDYKIGVSLLDIGYVSLRQDAEKHAFTNSVNTWINVQDISYDNIHDEIRTASYLLEGDSSATFIGSKFTVFLPTSLNLFFDYNYRDPFYVGGFMALPVKFTETQVERPVVIGVIPRYETRELEISIPVTLYKFQYPRIGLSIRIWDFTVGTEKLGSFLSYKDFTGMDFYFSYKINLTEKRKKDKRYPCYFN